MRWGLDGEGGRLQTSLDFPITQRCFSSVSYQDVEAWPPNVCSYSEIGQNPGFS